MEIPPMKKKILCIDDSNSALLLLEFALLEAGMEAIIASSVKQAIEEISRHKPDLILLDLSMPEVSGYDFLRMRSELNIQDIPIMVISAHDSHESVKKAKEMGATEFIAKPIHIDSIIKRIKLLLNS
jgi:two-component system sensor histidine kinase/response regulator